MGMRSSPANYLVLPLFLWVKNYSASTADGHQSPAMGARQPETPKEK